MSLKIPIQHLPFIPHNLDSIQHLALDSSICMPFPSPTAHPDTVPTLSRIYSFWPPPSTSPSGQHEACFILPPMLPPNANVAFIFHLLPPPTFLRSPARHWQPPSFHPAPAMWHFQCGSHGDFLKKHHLNQPHSQVKTLPICHNTQDEAQFLNQTKVTLSGQALLTPNSLLLDSLQILLTR